MKKIILFFLSTLTFTSTYSQLKPKVQCPTFVVDILDGKVNGLKANAQDYDVKSALPCFTSVEADGSNAKCGGVIYYKEQDIYFFTERDYVEIGEKFKGKLNVPLMGGKRNTFFQTLGNPKMKDAGWDAFQMSYGTLVLHYNSAGKVNKIQFSTNGTDLLSLCE